MLAGFRSIRKKTWMKIWISYVVIVGLFLLSLMLFLQLFIMLPYPDDNMEYFIEENHKKEKETLFKLNPNDNDIMSGIKKDKSKTEQSKLNIGINNQHYNAINHNNLSSLENQLNLDNKMEKEYNNIYLHPSKHSVTNISKLIPDLDFHFIDNNTQVSQSRIATSPEMFAKNPADIFPKILHHTWKSHEIPSIWQNSYNSCISLNKDYTFKLWTDEDIENFMTEHYAWFKPQFDSYKYSIQKIDVFRYFVLYHYGGIYIDLDIKCKYPFTDILQEVTENHGILLPGTWPVGISNEFMAAKQHHPFLKFSISKLKHSHHEYGLHYFTILASTGPLFLSRCLTMYPNKNADVYSIPMTRHKWYYFQHVEGDSWQWWDAWLVNSRVSWITALVIVFLLDTCIVVKCCSNKKNSLKLTIY